MHDLIISQEDAALLDQYLIRYLEDTGVRVVLLMGRDGYLLTKQGDSKDVAVESLCALAIGAFASSEALARLSGEDSFNSIFHQGVRCNVYIAMVGDDHLLLSLFDYHASAPLVRLQAKITTEVVINILERASARTRAARSDV
ncbi:MAG TPA: roadblock/LC7 domain-containing protein [Armatimonadota bacterium]|jgi:predicted regulator of Ras-like GTPase activity (Roadblock/LC7/MglB family)